MGCQSPSLCEVPAPGDGEILSEFIDVQPYAGGGSKIAPASQNL